MNAIWEDAIKFVRPVPECELPYALAMRIDAARHTRKRLPVAAKTPNYSPEAAARQDRLLAAIKKTPGLTLRELTPLGKDAVQVKNDVQKLRDGGLCHFVRGKGYFFGPSLESIR